MSGKYEELFTFRGASPEQVADLCELWEGSVVECSRRRGIVRVRSDRISIDQFLMFYELSEFMECGKQENTQAQEPDSRH